MNEVDEIKNKVRFTRLNTKLEESVEKKKKKPK